jgi:uncharacterized membrane protein
MNGWRWHPMIVHFPLALVCIACLCLLLARLRPRAALAPSLARVGTWNLCFGAVFIVLALGSGLGAVLDLEVSQAAHQAISLHLKWAMGTSLALLLLAAWRGAGNVPTQPPSPLFTLLLCAATAALLMTAYRGGINVYHFGIGVDAVH